MSRTLPILILALSGCGEPADTDPGLTQQPGGSTSEASCVVLTETALGATDLGAEFDFTPEDLLLQLEGDWGDLLEWPQDYNSAGLAANITYDAGAMTYFEREVDGVPSLELAAECITAIEVEVQLTIQSSDDALDEVLSITLVATQRDKASFTVTIPSADIMGTWTPEFSDVDVTGFASWELMIEGQATDIGTSGSLIVVAYDADGAASEFKAGDWAPPISPS